MNSGTRTMPMLKLDYFCFVVTVIINKYHHPTPYHLLDLIRTVMVPYEFFLSSSQISSTIWSMWQNLFRPSYRLHSLKGWIIIIIKIVPMLTFCLTVCPEIFPSFARSLLNVVLAQMIKL